MNNGVAVVIGALIALVGSSVVPWIREALAARSIEKKERRERVREAVIDLSTATARAANARVGRDVTAMKDAVQERARALSRLTMEVKLRERAPIHLAARLAITREDDTMRAATALQLALAAWYAGDIAAERIPEQYQSDLAALIGQKGQIAPPIV